jgi:hypothetical protein
MPTQPTQPTVRRDVEPLHHFSGALVTDSWQALQQIYDFHMSQDVVAGG